MSNFKVKRWKNYDKLVAPYREYELVDLGVIPVNPSDIIGLSLHVRDIKNDESMVLLRESVASKGWLDVSPYTLHLCRLPNGKCSVCSGGNHRAYLSNELKIAEIKALVSIVIPIKMFTEGIKAKLEYIRLKEHENDFEAKKINDWLNKQGIYRVTYEKEEKLFNYYCEQSENLEEKRKEVLLKLAEENNQVPN
jgi:hypothetical protein